jgi:cytochrome c556
MKRFFVALSLSLLCFSGVALAQQSPNDVIEARQTALKKAGAGMKGFAAFLQEGKGTPEELKAHAAAIQVVAKDMPGWWPKGTEVGVGKSAALPAIWEKPDDYKARMVAFKNEADAMVKAAATGDKAAIGAQLGKLGGTCKGCHDAYRKP